MIPLRKPRGARAARPLFLWAAGLALLIGGCGDDAAVIEDIRDRVAPYDYIPRTARQRFEQESARQNPHGHGNNPHGGGGPILEWELPEGWREVEKTQHRQANFRVGEKTECYLSILPGGGGGLVANVNRWRKQMGLEAQTPEQIKELPKSKLFIDATVVDVEGTFTGMGGGEPMNDARMLGLVASAQRVTVVLKMVGPKSEVDLQRGAFFRLAKSFREKRPEGHGTQGGGGAAGPAKFQYKTPDGWSAVAPTQYRDINFKIGNDVQCYVSVLVGGGGGVFMNVNRWRNQMGKPPLSRAELANLEKLRLLGEDAPFLQMTGGKYSGMDGRKVDDAAMYATLVEHKGRLVTVKMTGAAKSVAAQRAKFVAFCESLETVQ